MNYTIAIVEDDQLIINMIAVNLKKQNFSVFCFTSGDQFLQKADNMVFDLIILDILLPGMTGIETLKELRARGVNGPVLMLTVRQEIKNKVTAFNLGADDYLTKPFNMDELLARIQALIRRSHGLRNLPSSQVIFINNYKINLATRVCESNMGKVILSEKEINLLSFLFLRSGESLSRADILEEVWGMDVSPTLRTIDNFILKYRKLFEINPENPDHFVSIRNKGYCFVR